MNEENGQKGAIEYFNISKKKKLIISSLLKAMLEVLHPVDFQLTLMI